MRKKDGVSATNVGTRDPLVLSFTKSGKIADGHPDIQNYLFSRTSRAQDVPAAL